MMTMMPMPIVATNAVVIIGNVITLVKWSKVESACPRVKWEGERRGGQGKSGEERGRAERRDL